MLHAHTHVLTISLILLMSQLRHLSKVTTKSGYFQYCAGHLSFQLTIPSRWRTFSDNMQPGEGNGNPLQYSCLENPKDRGAWWVAVYGVAQSRTRLKRFSSISLSSRGSLKSCLSFQGRLKGVWGSGEGPAHCVTGDAITQGRGGAAASFK